MVVRRGNRRAAQWLLSAALTGSMAGCAGSNRIAGDPLLGASAATPPARAAAGPAPPPAAPVALTPPVATASTAALAQNSMQPLDNTHDLRISEPRSETRPFSFQPASTAPSPAPVNPCAVPANPCAAPVSAPPASAAVSTYEQALALLTARGVTYYRLENVGERGICKFSCSLPNPQNRAINRVYEAQAPDYLSAMRAVLDQISRDH
jgi:hypothetical protein